MQLVLEINRSFGVFTLGVAVSIVFNVGQPAFSTALVLAQAS
jgi:hypothetical protein